MFDAEQLLVEEHLESGDGDDVGPGVSVEEVVEGLVADAGFGGYLAFGYFLALFFSYVSMALRVLLAMPFASSTSAGTLSSRGPLGHLFPFFPLTMYLRGALRSMASSPSWLWGCRGLCFPDIGRDGSRSLSRRSR